MPDQPYDSTVIPNGIDWADGIDSRPGTPTSDPRAAVTQSAYGDFPASQSFVYEEEPNSPEIERGEQGTIQHRFTMDYYTGLTYLAGLGRGAYLIDSQGDLTKVMTSRIVRGPKANMSTLTVTAESISFDTPPDDFRVEVIELNPSLEKHPRYAFLPTDIRQLVNQSVTAAQIATTQQVQDMLSSIHTRDPATNPPPTGSDWQMVQDAATELLLKRRIGEDTFYLPGFRVTWVQFFYLPQFLNPGGYVEDPIIDGGLPAYFWSLDQTPDGDSIFDNFSEINPQFYSTGISWLRQSDVVDYARTWFRITHTWIGAPYAHWDAQVYSREPSPYPPPPQIPMS